MGAEWVIDDNENTEEDKAQKIEYMYNHWICYDVFPNSFNKELLQKIKLHMALCKRLCDYSHCIKEIIGDDAVMILKNILCW